MCLITNEWFLFDLVQTFTYILFSMLVYLYEYKPKNERK